MPAPLAFLSEDYEVIEPLSETGGGHFYRLRHRSSGTERVAELIPVPRGDEALKQRLSNAAAILARLENPHFAPIDSFGFGEGGLAYLVLERPPGRGLAEVLENLGPPPVPLALELACQAARSLAAIHRQGLLHRDITPGRLLLSRDKEGLPALVWIEFGLARLVEATASGGLYLGKVRYAAPENFGTGEGAEVSGASDVYSLALVLYELFTGCFPIEGTSATSIIAGHLFRPPMDFDFSDPEGKIPETIRGVLLSALAKQRGERPADAMAFARALTSTRPERLDLGPEEHAWMVRALGGEADRSTSRQPEASGSSPGTGVSGTEWLRDMDESGEEEVRVSTMAQIESFLAQGELDRAEEVFVQAASSFAADPRWLALGRRIEQTRAEVHHGVVAGGDRGRRAATLVERARTLSGSENFQEAQRLLREAVEIDPEHPEALLLSRSLESLMAWRDQEDQGRRALDEAVDKIRRLLEERRTGEAMAQLQKAISRYGAVADLQELRRATADAFLYGEAYLDPREEEEPAPVAVPRTTQPVPHSAFPEAPQPPPPPPIASTPGRTMDVAGPTPQSVTYEERHHPLLEPMDSRSPGPASPLDDLPLAGLGEEAREPLPGLPAPDPTPPTPRGSLDMTDPRTWLMVILVVVSFLLLGLWLARQGREPLPGPHSTPEVEDVRPSLETEEVSQWGS